MIKTLQAMFYITWIVVGIVFIAGVFVVITTFPFEKLGAILEKGPHMEEENMSSPSVGPPFSSSPSPQGQLGAPPEIGEREREMITRVLGKQRAEQIKTWDDLTVEEQQKVEKYFGGPPSNNKAP